MMAFHLKPISKEVSKISIRKVSLHITLEKNFSTSPRGNELTKVNTMRVYVLTYDVIIDYVGNTIFVIIGLKCQH